MTGDIHLAFDRPIPATETAGAPAASAAATAAPEAVFARPPSLIPTAAARDAPPSARPWAPHLAYRRRFTPATPLDGGPAMAMRNTQHPPGG